MNPDSGSVLAGLARDDLFTVVAEQFMTDTARSRGRGDGPRPPALQDSDEALLATYLEGYGRADVDQLWERGWVKIRPQEDPRPKALLRSEAMLRLGQDPVPDAHEPQADDGQLVVLTPKSHHFLNSNAVNHARLRTMAGGPRLLLAAADAAARDVTDGDLVELTSETGTMTVAAEVSGDVLAGTAILVSNWWNDDFPGGRGANALTDQALTDVGGAPLFQVRARVTPVPAPAVPDAHVLI